MPYEGLSLKGQTALVTGSARGIGAALAVGAGYRSVMAAMLDRNLSLGANLSHLPEVIKSLNVLAVM